MTLLLGWGQVALMLAVAATLFGAGVIVGAEHRAISMWLHRK